MARFTASTTRSTPAGSMAPSGSNDSPSRVGSLTACVGSGGAPGRASKTCNWAEFEPMSKTPSSIRPGYPRPIESCTHDGKLEVCTAGQRKAVLHTAHDHDDWNAEARGETPMQRADRAYAEILQEVRVAQTGVQILFAFLLALAFQARFPAITSFQRGVYVVTLMLCAAATALLIAPAAFHRMIYRKRLKQHLVRVANRMAITGLALLLLSMVSAVLLIMDVVLGRVPAFILAAAVLTWFTMWWFVLPLQTRVRDLAADNRRPDGDGPSG